MGLRVLSVRSLSTNTMASDKQIVLISGGNTGVGLEVARKLLREHGETFHVIIGSRNLAKGDDAVRELREEGCEGVEAVQLDVTSEESVAAAAQTIEARHGRLDVLHVNAGIAPEVDFVDDGSGAGPRRPPLSELLSRTVATNVAGAAATVEHMAPLLGRAAAATTTRPPRIVFMSASGGSLAGAHADGHVVDTYPAYCASKAALNMLALHYYHRFPGWKVNMCCPGFRATRLNRFGAVAAGFQAGPLEEGAVNAVRLSLLGPDGESGTFSRLGRDGGYESVAW